jgi:hypothetical protein
MNRKTRLLGMGILLLSSAGAPLARAEPDDMWLEDFRKASLFTPHGNFCDSSTEVFVSMGTRANRGFCIEKTERSGTMYWEDARQDCASGGKRLPEVGEWRYACRQVSGFSNSTSTGEWGSNSSYVLHYDTPDVWAVVAPKLGLGSRGCDSATHGIIATYATWSTEALSYRCVR